MSLNAARPLQIHGKQSQTASQTSQNFAKLLKLLSVSNCFQLTAFIRSVVLTVFISVFQTLIKTAIHNTMRIL